MTGQHALQVSHDPAQAARAAARHIAVLAAAAVDRRGEFTLAVSGGRTPWAMIAALTQLDLPWQQTRLFQVDERVAPAGDPDRNLTHLTDTLTGVTVEVVPMPVEASDLDAAAAQYATRLPRRLDLVHLGLGPDGHTASLVPGDPVLSVDDRDVVVTAHPYQGRRRMTLTYPCLGRARQTLWLVTGADKRHALKRLLAGDPAIPAGRVHTEESLVLADVAAAPPDHGTGAP